MRKWQYLESDKCACKEKEKVQQSKGIRSPVGWETSQYLADSTGFTVKCDIWEKP